MATTSRLAKFFARHTIREPEKFKRAIITGLRSENQRIQWGSLNALEKAGVKRPRFPRCGWA